MDESSQTKHSGSCTCFRPLPLLMLSCSLHSCPSHGLAFSRCCCSQQPVQHVLMPIRHFDVNANSLSTRAFIFGLKASNDVKNSSLSCLLLPSSQPTFHSKCRQCYLGKNYTAEPLVGAHFGVVFFSFTLENVFRYRSVSFSRQGFIYICCMLSAGWATGRTPPDFLPASGS